MTSRDPQRFLSIDGTLVDVAAGTLTKGQVRTHLSPRAMSVLVFLAHRPGEVVSREAILSSVWAGLHVSDDVLTQAVTTLRKAFGDSARDPRIIQTLTKRGYRLIAKVQECSRLQRSGPARVRRFTVDGGAKREPRFSPDGRAVAYVWSGTSRDSWDLYVKAVGSGSAPLRLTNSSEEDRSPVWSPDGRHIAFVRVPPLQIPASSGQAAIYIVPSSGGGERLLARIRGDVYANEYFLPALAWSPCGRYLAYGERPSRDEPARLVRLGLDRLERTPLTEPPSSSMGDYAGAFSPDGTVLVFIRMGSDVWGHQDLWIHHLETGQSRQLSHQGYSEVSQPVWPRESRYIHYVTDTGAWKIDPEGGVPLLVPGLGLSAGGLSVWRNRLVHVERARGDSSVWRTPLAGSPADDHPRRLFVGSWQKISPDGRRIAYASDRTGIFNLWVCDSDGTNPVQLTDSGVASAAPSWSPDGTRLAFDTTDHGKGDLCIVSLDGGPPRRLTRGPGANVLPTWSRDGEWIYFQSTRTGRPEIWRMAADGDAVMQVTYQGGYFCLESGDKKDLLFTRREMSGLWRVPLQGGAETKVTDEQLFYSHWAVAAKGVYYIHHRAIGQRWDYTLNLLDSSRGRTARVISEIGVLGPGMIDVAPNGKWMACAREECPDSELILIEDFE